ncbi:PREDICTED: rho GTPase-activating protein gacU-like [Polistes canadensis]|uniref:rho GTPase-activating protein gacU-like n=1 Tax=Polistes canadensis TaxID=91411 RepID=UPI000718FCE5|nr:PREDICTED: rho GTPase-activating protein gacU-like [Polistes canadensis]
MPIIQLLLYLVTVVLCNVHGSLEHEIPRRSFLSRRAIDGTRGRKYFDPEEEGTFDSYGSAGGQYDRYKDKQDHSDIRMNVPGEPEIDYPAYTTLPQTGFSCEGRSRGYYADEVAGCQVFHVCHDILVSSFLCPIGSIFSQKLLTCDWWSKVDCSTTRKFIETNHDNHYQEDDDELIRKAYGMMGLQTGTDVASDELVDPDRGGKIIDYITIDSTRNDLPIYRNDFPREKNLPNQFFSTYEEHSERTNPIYTNSFYNKNYFDRAYHDSPIIRIEKIGEENYRERESGRYDYQDIRDKLGKRINEFQPSYAPTVPTVTTTTRKLYSPTIPTTNRPSTLVYNRFDQDIESSDHLYTHSQESKSFFTLSTLSSFNKNSKGKYNDSNTQSYKNYNEDQDRDHLKEEPSDSYEVIKRIDSVDERLEDSFIGEEYIDDIEIKESIGIGRALNGSNKFRIHVEDSKNNAKGTNENSSLSLNSNRYNLTESIGSNIESIDQLQTDTTDTVNYASILEKSTTPMIEYLSHFKHESSNTEIEEPSTTLSYKENITSTETTIPLDTKLYSTENPGVFSNDEFKSGTIIDSTILQPDIILKPPVITEAKFRINVPDYPSTKTPIFHTSYNTIYSEMQSTTQIPIDEHLINESTNVSIPWFQHTTDFPATDIEPPFIGFNLKDTIDEIVTQTSRFDTPIKTGNEDDKIRRNSRQQEEAKFVSELIEISGGEDRTNIATNIKSISSIEDAIELNKSPYQISVTLNTKNESVPIKDDLIISLIKQHERNNSRPDRLGQLEIVKSIEGITDNRNNDFPYNDNNKIPFFKDTMNLSSNQKEIEGNAGSDKLGQIEIVKSIEGVTDNRNSDLPYNDNNKIPFFKDTMILSNNQKEVESNASTSNVNNLSLLQLMAELLKIDHIPRPFSLNHLQGFKSNSDSNWDQSVLPTTTIKSIDDSLPKEKIIENVNSNNDKRNVMPRLRDILEGTPRSITKNRVLDELTNNFDRPLNNVENRLAINSQLPQIQRSLDFEESKEFNNSPKTSFRKTTNNTESVKTVVETEFLPSIGFSFDTSEGRKKYIDAILDGLLDESIHESNTNKSLNVEMIDKSSYNDSRSSLAQI